MVRTRSARRLEIPIESKADAIVADVTEVNIVDAHVKEEGSKENEKTDVKENFTKVAQASGLSLYEQKRRLNMERNARMLEKLGLDTVKSQVHQMFTTTDHFLNQKKSKAGNLKAAKRKKPMFTQDEDAHARLRRRRSSRLKGEAAENIQVAVDSVLYEPEPRKHRFDAEPIPLECLNDPNGEGQNWLSRHATAFIDETNYASKVAAPPSSEDLRPFHLHEKDVMKVTPERIYSVAFCPTSEKLLVATGDKAGHLGLWAPDDDLKASEENGTGTGSTGSTGNVCVYRPHTSQIYTVLFDGPTSQSHRLLTCSYDGTIRVLDLKHSKAFTQVFATQRGGGGEGNDLVEKQDVDDESSAGLMSMIMDASSNSIVASTNDGCIEVVDERMKVHVGRICLHEKKINTVHQSPQNPHIFITASLDRTLCIWDNRKFNYVDKPTSLHSAAKLGTLTHPKSINCAYFSPTGEHIVSVCQDDFLYLFDGAVANDSLKTNRDSFTYTQRMYHKNNTGRWVTKFHAVWDPKKPTRFLMGSMRQPRCLEMFDACFTKATGVAKQQQPQQQQPMHVFQSEFFNSIHPINDLHPTLNVIASGNSSGRMALWRYDATTGV